MFVAFVAAFVAVLATAATVGAHQIDVKKLQKFDLEITRGACKYDPTCYGVVVEPCQKLSARVAQCKVHYWGELLTGPYDCEWIDQFKLARNSNQFTWNKRVFDQTYTCYDNWGGHHSLRARAGATGEGERADLRNLIPARH